MLFFFVDQAGQEDLHEFVLRGMRLMWSYVGIILDHIILWWIDTPISCYSLTHVDSIRNWLFMLNIKGHIRMKSWKD